eukprot:1141441-Pelagomonas_calceolata.AAC.2
MLGPCGFLRGHIPPQFWCSLRKASMLKDQQTQLKEAEKILPEASTQKRRAKALRDSHNNTHIFTNSPLPDMNSTHAWPHVQQRGLFCPYLSMCA